MKIKQYIQNIFYGLDQFINALLLGDPNETISSRCARVREVHKNKCNICRVLCIFLHLLDKNHCTKYLETIEYIGKRDLLYPTNIEE